MTHPAFGTGKSSQQMYDEALAAVSRSNKAKNVMAEKYDDVLLPFLASMRRELHANAGKGDRPGWLAMTRDQVMLEIYYHVAKLQKAMRDGNAAAIEEHAADVANMAMMALDIGVGIKASPAAGPTAPPPLDDELRQILGLPNFRTGPIAHRLVKLGHVIPPKMEQEQAYVLHWLMGLYAAHGADWRKEADNALFPKTEASNG
jgi:hypothetical protein